MTDAAPQKKRRSRAKVSPPSPQRHLPDLIAETMFGGDLADMAKAHFGATAVAGIARLAITGGREVKLGDGSAKHRLLLGGLLVVDPGDDTFCTKAFEFTEATVIIIPRKRVTDDYRGRYRLDQAVTCLDKIDFDKPDEATA